MKSFQLILCLGFAASSAMAASQTLPKTPVPEDVRLIHDFSRCVAKYRTDSARALLETDYRTADYGTAVRRLAQPDFRCALSGRLQFHGVVFVGGIAEELLEQDLKNADLAARVAHDASRPLLQARDEGEYVGLCTVRAAPAEVAHLLSTAPASKAEEGALKAVQPALASCVASGSSARFNSLGLRSLLALGAYRLSAHNQQTQTAGN